MIYMFVKLEKGCWNRLRQTAACKGLRGDEEVWMRIYEWIDRHHTLLSFMGSAELPGYYSRFFAAFYYGFDDPCNVDLFRCRDCYWNNLHKPSMELPGSRSRNYLETTNGTTQKVPKELPGNYVDILGVLWINLETA